MHGLFFQAVSVVEDVIAPAAKEVGMALLC
jgi:hypothetical protein